jgi:hypothetical protein
MIPVIDWNQVNVAWVEIRGAGFVLYGFMLYSDQDTALVEYMQRQSGLAELDVISGPECAIFVVESPSRKWVEHARRTDHPWWRLIGSRTAEFNAAENRGNSKPPRDVIEVLAQHQNSILIAIGEDQSETLRHFLEPDYGSLYDRNEIWEVVRHFGLTAKDIPCLAFFQDLDQGDIDVVSLREIGTAQRATLSLRDFFAGRDFERLLEKARKYV